VRHFNKAVLLLGALLWAHVCRAADQYTIEVPVRGPDARPLLDAEIEVRELEGDHFENRPARVVECKTNSRGIARFTWPKAIDSVIVIARGVGYGRTGTFEIVGDKGEASLPPLAPFGSIAGTVPKDALGANTTITLWAGHDWTVVAKVGNDGRFVLKDVPAGTWSLQPVSGQISLDVWASIRLRAGEHIDGVRFNRREKDDTEGGSISVYNQHDREVKTTWVTGVVRDRAGKPISGVLVNAVSQYFGGIRMYEEMHGATTDASGRFAIEGSAIASSGGTLFAYKEGFTPLIDWFPGRYIRVPGTLISAASSTQPATTRPAPSADLVLNDQGGSLDIVVLQDGKPVSNAAVMLQSSNLGEIESRLYVGSSSGPERDAVTGLLQPKRNADAQGVAHFTHLLPGIYEVYACTDGKMLQFLPEHVWPTEPSVISGTAKGVPVSGQQVSTFVLPISAHSHIATVRSLRIKGWPISKATSSPWTIGQSYEVFGPENRRLSNSDLKIGDDGLVSFAADAAGLWYFEATYRDSESRLSLSDLPYNRAKCMIAVSSLIKTLPTATATARRFEGGSLEVEVKDINGKPIHAAVLLDNENLNQSCLAGATDASGSIKFESLFPWEHSIEIQPLGGRDSERIDAFSTDDALRGRSSYLVLKAKTGINNETHVIARPVKMGFITGRFTPPLGRNRSDYYWFANSETARDIPLAYDDQTGRYVMGPIPAGKIELYLYRNKPNTLVESHKLEIAEGEVVHLDLSPSSDLPEVAPTSRTWGGEPSIFNLLKSASSSERFRVVMSDRKSPAFGATLNIYDSNENQPRISGIVDASGRMRFGGHSFFLMPNDDVIPRGSPKGPVLVARLPGSCGATIVPLPDQLPDEGMTIILPPPMFLPGRVTISGAAPVTNSGRITVMAAREELGKLNSELSVTMSAQANGKFALSGLTPGRYRVQADLDGIWFSSAFMIEVPSAGKLKPLTLDISPGGALIVRIVDKNGAPAIGVPLKISRPEGPLADSLWPADLETDGAGIVRIPALEVGMHEVTVSSSKPHQINIPPLKDDATAQEMEITRPEVNGR
jgi:hypothetical protein